VIYDAFKAAVQADVAKAGILVDEQFGAAIVRDAVAQGDTTSCPAEKSGQSVHNLCQIEVTSNPRDPTSHSWSK
jgi:myo-inositol catabolism protein IolC